VRLPSLFNHMKKYQVVLDTNVIISSLLSKNGSSAKLLRQVGGDKFDINISAKLILEYEDVLKREAFSNWWSSQDVDNLLDYLCAVGKRHQIWFLWRPFLPDAKDDFIAELALKSGVDYIITHNTQDFQRLTELGSKVITPKEFLKLIGEES